MDAAVIEIASDAPTVRLDPDRVRDVLLLRLAVADRALPRETIERDLAPIVAHVMTGDAWRKALDRDLSALADAGLADLKPTSAAATEAGLRRAALMFSGRAPFPKTWLEARDVRLVARVLGLDHEPANRLRALARPDGLRAAIVMKAFSLKIRGAPSPVKLRAALAKVALARAFGGEVNTAQGRSALSAKAGRALAGRLASSPRDFKTDARLIGALAADQAGAPSTDLSALQLALLRRFVTQGDAKPSPAQRPRRRATIAAPCRGGTGTPTRQPDSAAPLAHAPSTGAQRLTPDAVPALTIPASVPPSVGARPSLQAFAREVKAIAETVAEGFVGNRRAFISQVWSKVLVVHPHWGLSDVEFKCMLAEAHRAGALVLANADLKDGRRLADIQASALSYRNAVFHYVRVDT